VAADFDRDGGTDLAVGTLDTRQVFLNLSVASLSTTSENFGSVKLGVTSPARKVTLRDPSGTAFSISTVSISGANASDFAETNTA